MKDARRYLLGIMYDGNIFHVLIRFIYSFTSTAPKEIIDIIIN